MARSDFDLLANLVAETSKQKTLLEVIRDKSLEKLEGMSKENNEEEIAYHEAIQNLSLTLMDSLEKVITLENELMDNEAERTKKR